MEEELVQEYQKIIKDKLSQGRYDSALESAQKVTKHYPKSEHGYYFQAICHFAQENFDLAIVNYEKALHFNTNLAKARYNLGLCYFRKGRVDNALISIGAALVLFSKMNDKKYRQRCMEALNLMEKERNNNE